MSSTSSIVEVGKCSSQVTGSYFIDSTPIIHGFPHPWSESSAGLNTFADAIQPLSLSEVSTQVRSSSSSNFETQRRPSPNMQNPYSDMPALHDDQSSQMMTNPSYTGYDTNSKASIPRGSLLGSYSINVDNNKYQSKMKFIECIRSLRPTPYSKLPPPNVSRQVVRTPKQRFCYFDLTSVIPTKYPFLKPIGLKMSEFIKTCRELASQGDQMSQDILSHWQQVELTEPFLEEKLTILLQTQNVPFFPSNVYKVLKNTPVKNEVVQKYLGIISVHCKTRQLFAKMLNRISLNERIR